MKRKNFTNSLKHLSVLSGLLLLTLSLSGCIGKSSDGQDEIRRFWGEAGDKIVYQDGREQVLPWQWIVKPMADELQR